MGKRAKRITSPVPVGARPGYVQAQALAILACAASIACAACAPASTPSHARSAPASPPVRLNLPPQAAEVTAVRRLEFRREVAVNDVTRARFRHVIRDVLDRSPVDDEEGTFVRAFGFTPLEVRPSREATVRSFVEGLLGLYVPYERAIYLRPREGAPPESNREAILIHELVHAAQDDRFGMTAMYDPSIRTDEQLARRAVYEGDATVATSVILGARAGKSRDEALGERETTWKAEAMIAGSAQEIEFQAEAPPETALNRASAYFPYTAGAFFVAQVLRAGGPDMVSLLFEHLPTTTEQILHPEKYFAGEGAIPVTTPAPPPGWMAVAEGRMGELRARILLGLALPVDRSVPATAGWGGDAYAVVAHPGSDRLAILWSTAWDDEASATRFAAALEEATRCKVSDAHPCPLGPVALRRRGARVAWVRGLDDGEAHLDALLRLPGDAPRPRPPLGAVHVPAAHLSSEAIVPLADRDVRIASVALHGRVPDGFDLLRVHDQDMVVEDRAHHGRGALRHGDGPFDDAHVLGVRSMLTALFGSTYAGLVAQPTVDVDLPLGHGKELRWGFEDGHGGIKVAVIPLCNGRQILTLLRVARTEEAWVMLSQWAQSIEPTSPGLPPACDAPTPPSPAK
jgi:hypothetical protein